MDETVVDNREIKVQEAPKVSRIGDDPTCATFVIQDEDHTLGNATRHLLMGNPQVELAGYSVPHPLENKMHLRIQTYPGTVTAEEALVAALDNFTDMIDHVLSTFDEAVDRFETDALDVA